MIAYIYNKLFVVKKYDFIFSNHLRHRIARHFLFWFVWYVFMLLTYHFPIMVFPDWNIKDNLYKVTQEGGWVNFLFYRAVILYGRSLLIAIAFTYSIIYFVVPRLINKKNWIITIAICLIIFS